MAALAEVQKSEWYQTRPKIIQGLIDQFPPVSSVLIKSTGQMGYIYSWAEDNTVTIIIDPDAEENKNISNAMSVMYRVFGYGPDDIEFIRENPPEVGLMLGKKMDELSENQVICGECDQPKIPGYLCPRCVGDSNKEACAYHGGFCCECEALEEKERDPDTPHYLAHKPECPHCKTVLDGYSEVNGSKEKPGPGDYTVCIKCANVLVVKDDMQYRLLAEDDTLGDGILLQLQKAQKIIRAMNDKS